MMTRHISRYTPERTQTTSTLQDAADAAGVERFPLERACTLKMSPTKVFFVSQGVLNMRFRNNCKVVSGGEPVFHRSVRSGGEIVAQWRSCVCRDDCLVIFFRPIVDVVQRLCLPCRSTNINASVMGRSLLIRTHWHIYIYTYIHKHVICTLPPPPFVFLPRIKEDSEWWPADAFAWRPFAEGAAVCSQTFAKRRVLVGVREYVMLLESGGVGVDALNELRRRGGGSCFCACVRMQ